MNAACSIIATAVCMAIGATTAAAQTTRERPKNPTFAAGNERSIRDKCLAETSTVVSPDLSAISLMEKRRANLLQLCIERKGKL